MSGDATNRAAVNETSQWGLLRSRRFLPFFLTQFLGAFNDNVFKNALQLMIAFELTMLAGIASETWVNLAAGLFIYKEALTTSQYVGFGVALAGVFLINLRL